MNTRVRSGMDLFRWKCPDCPSRSSYSRVPSTRPISPDPWSGFRPPPPCRAWRKSPSPSLLSGSTLFWYTSCTRNLDPATTKSKMRISHFLFIIPDMKRVSGNTSEKAMAEKERRMERKRADLEAMVVLLWNVECGVYFLLLHIILYRKFICQNHASSGAIHRTALIIWCPTIHGQTSTIG